MKKFWRNLPKKRDRDYIKRKTEEFSFDPKVATDELVDEVFAVVNDRMKGIKTVLLAVPSNIICCMILQNKTTNLYYLGKQDGVTPPDVVPKKWIDKFLIQLVLVR